MEEQKQVVEQVAKLKQPVRAPHISYTDAAELVLRDKEKPLSHRQLSSLAQKGGFITPESETPHISMYVSLRSEIKRRAERGEPQRFMFLGNGMFTLADIAGGVPAQKVRPALDQVRESRREACQELYKKLTGANQGSNFETMVADLLTAMGYEDVQVIGGKDDQGVDILCEKRDGITKQRIAVQCKCKTLAKEIGPKDVSTLRDNLSTYQCQQGILVTTSRLNESVRKKATEPGKEPIHFIEHEETLDLLAEHGIGMRSESLRYFQVDSSQYDFLK